MIGMTFSMQMDLFSQASADFITMHVASLERRRNRRDRRRR